MTSALHETIAAKNFSVSGEIKVDEVCMEAGHTDHPEMVAQLGHQGNQIEDR